MARPITEAGGGLKVTPHTLRGIQPGTPNYRGLGFKPLPVPSIKLPVFNLRLPSFTPPTVYGRGAINNAMKTGADQNNRLKQVLRSK